MILNCNDLTIGFLENHYHYEKKGIVTGKYPMRLAAASLYVACVLEGEKKTQKEIAEVANVTDVTVRNRYKGLEEALNILASSIC